MILEVSGKVLVKMPRGLRLICFEVHVNFTGTVSAALFVPAIFFHHTSNPQLDINSKAHLTLKLTELTVTQMYCTYSINPSKCRNLYVTLMTCK